MNLCFNCSNKEKEDTIEIKENNESEQIIKKEKNNTISSIQNQKTRTNSQIKNKSVSSYSFSKEHIEKSNNIKKSFVEDSLLQISSIGFNSSMNSSVSNLSSLRFCYDDEDDTNNIQKKSTNKLRPPRTKIVYDN